MYILQVRVQVKFQTKTRAADVAETVLLLRVRDTVSLEFTVIDERFATTFPVTDESFFAVRTGDMAKHSRAVEEALPASRFATSDDEERRIDFVVVDPPTLRWNRDGEERLHVRSLCRWTCHT